MSPDRRTVLKVGGLAAALGATGLAGCNGFLGDSEELGPADYRYDPSALVETENVFFGNLDYAALYENREYFPDSEQDMFEPTEDTDFDPEELDAVTGVGGAQISVGESTSSTVFVSLAVLGSFEASTVQSDLEDEEAEQIGEYEGYTLYEETQEASNGNTIADDTSYVVAVRDGVVIAGVAETEGEAVTEVTSREAAEAMVDAANEEVDRLDTDGEYMSQLSDRFGDATMTMGARIDSGVTTLATTAGGQQAGQYVDGLRGGGVGMTVDGETTTIESALLYEDSEAAEDTGIVDVFGLFEDQAVEEDNGITDITTEYDGNAVVITLAGETKRLFEESAESASGGDLAATDTTDSVATRLGTDAENVPTLDGLVSGDPSGVALASVTDTLTTAPVGDTLAGVGSLVDSVGDVRSVVGPTGGDQPVTDL